MISIAILVLFAGIAFERICLGIFALRDPKQDEIEIEIESEDDDDDEADYWKRN
jgi:hypothetical protein